MCGADISAELVMKYRFYCTYSRVQFEAPKSEFSHMTRCARSMLVLMRVLFLPCNGRIIVDLQGLKNNEQAHPRDTCSISITMKRC